MVFEEMGDFGAVLEENVGDTNGEDGRDGEAGDETCLFAGGGGDEGVGGAVVIPDFAATTGFGITLVAFFTRGENAVFLNGFTATSEGVSIFTGGAIFNFGDCGGFDTIPSFFINDFTLGAGVILLVSIHFAWGETVGDEPVLCSV